MTKNRLSQRAMALEIAACCENHADYELPDGGFERRGFVDWVMHGVGEDLVLEGNPKGLVESAASDAYDLMTPRFRS